MKNILLVLTGGTIGSISEHGIINTSDKAGVTLVNLFRQQYPENESICFKTIQPLPILSEYLHPLYWEKLITLIETENLSLFDGIIVTHGTDTLAFSAALLGLYFNYLKLPMVLVSSQYPLCHPEATGLQNFICAVEFIKQQRTPGVFVSYQNPAQLQCIHLATRLASSLQLSSDFFSVQSRTYMNFEQGRFIQQQAVNLKKRHKIRLKANFSSKILLLRPYPGLNYHSVNIDGFAAVLHDCYHSGTTCTSPEFGEQFSSLVFSGICRKQNVKLYMAPAVKSVDLYEGTQTLIKSGVEIIWNMSLESAYAKLLLAYGNFDEQQQINDFLQRDIALEHIQE